VAYLGNDLQVAFPTYRNIDDISGSFNGVTTSFPLTVDGVAPIPAPVNSQQCLISVNGVVQRPDDSGAEGFLLSGGNIVFASAPAGGVDFFGVILAGADYINIGANFPSGTALVPSITFDSDLDTGIYNPAGNQIGFTTAGVQRLVINSSGQVSGGLGSATTPAFSFLSDPNTGIYSPGADQVAVATNGTGRLFVDASGRVGIGTTSPTYLCNVIAAAGSQNIFQAGQTGVSNGYTITSNGTNLTHAWFNGGSEAARIDSSGRLLVGTSSTSATCTAVLKGRSDSTTAQPTLRLDIDGSSAPAGEIGYIFWGTTADTGFNRAADIRCARDGGTWTNNSSMPGRLEFATTADGASTATERMRITSAGNVGIGTTSPGSVCHVNGSNGNGLTVSGGGATGVFRSSAAGTELGSTSGDNTVFLSGSGTERMRIDSSGRVGIGTTSPSSSLHVKGAADSYLILQAGTTDGNDGILFHNSAGVQKGVIFFDTDNDYMLFSTNNTERMRIDSSGRLLVGTSTTSKDFSAVFQGNSADATGGANLLLARGTSSPADGSAIGYLSFTDSNHNTTAQIQAQRDGGTWTSGTSQPGRLVFSTTADGASSPTERMRISNAGNLYVANTGDTPVQSNTAGALTYRPAGQLEVNGNATQAAFFGRTNDGMVVGFYSGGTRRGDVSISGSTCSFNNTSDYRLKENVASIGNAVTRLNQLKPCRFNFIDEPSKTVDGFIAHEAQAVVPEAVTGEKDAVDADGNPVYQGIDQSKLVPLLTAALQEAIGEIESLKARVVALESA
jgi:hypothetical protein